MTDYQGLKYGNVQYPLPVQGSGLGGVGASLLRDADPVLFYTLEFYASVLSTHLNARFMEEVVNADVGEITSIVGETLPLDPAPFLTEEHIRYPLLAAYRKSSKPVWIGRTKHSATDFEVVYVLPPLEAGQAERLLPILRSVHAVLDNRTEQGFDPSYTPTMPTGSAGDSWWQRAGIVKAGVTGASYGAYGAVEGKLHFPCITLEVEITERSDFALTEFDTLNRGDVNIDIEDSTQETVVSNFIQFQVLQPPTLSSISPSTGSKAGGTSATLTGTGFVVGTLPTVFFGGLPATSVVVVNATTLTCVTPAHDAFTTFAADVVVTNPDGQSGTLANGFTYTTP